MNNHGLTKLFQFLKENLLTGRLRRSSALNACTPMLVPRKDGTDRLVIDLTPLNDITIHQRHKAARLEDALQHASKYRYFSKIDIKDAFWLLELEEESKYLTAFDTPWGTFEYNVLPQGWSDSPAHWQRYITYVLRYIIRTCCFPMADDILVFGDTPTECHVRTRQVLRSIRTSGMVENHNKTIVCAQTISFFGVSLTHGRWRPLQNDTTIKTWPVPRSKLALQQFLGTMNVFAQHTPRLAELIGPLVELTGEAKWSWTRKQDLAFEATKRAVLAQLWRHTHVAGGKQQLTTDASDRGLSAILEENGRPVAIISRQMTKRERQYDTKNREGLAIYWSTKQLAHIISDASTLIIRTDHENIVNALAASATNTRVNRWIDWWGNFPISWKWIRGKDNPADGPSRQWDHG